MDGSASLRLLHFLRTIINTLILLHFCLQFCVHSDKKKMLEELTNDIHQSPNKQKVLMELANCIASGEDKCHLCDPVLTLLSFDTRFQTMIVSYMYVSLITLVQEVKQFSLFLRGITENDTCFQVLSVRFQVQQVATWVNEYLPESC